MALGEMEFYSSALSRSVSFTFYLPDGEGAGPPPYPPLLQLHGAYDTHRAWATRSKLPLYLERYSFVTIMPNGELGSWSNWRTPGEPFEDFIIRDLLPASERFFPIRPGRWAIGGLSMGGYGALRLGLKYPDRFASIYAHSSAFYGRGRLRDATVHLSAEERADADACTHADSAVSRDDRPVVGFDCGVDDGLIDDNRAFHAHLDSIGYPHQYGEPPGGHTWFYWDEHVGTALEQHATVLAHP